VHSDDARHRQSAVDVRKVFSSAFEVLVDQRTRQPGRINLEQHEVSAPAEQAIRYGEDLMTIGAVDEPFARKRRWRIFTSGGRTLGFGLRGEVVDHVLRLGSPSLDDSIGSHLHASVKRIPFLDGIRGWGALVVLLYHVFVDGFPLSHQSQMALSRVFLFNGPLAVWLFFIVSGFSLSIAFVRDRDRMGLLKLAYGRYARLAVPILFFAMMMLLCVRAGMVPGVNDRPDRFKAILVVTPTLASTARFALVDVFFNYSDVTTMIPPLWTMPIELAGSVLVFSFCALVGTRSWRLAAYVFALGVAVIRPGLTYYGAFVAGMIFAESYDWPVVAQSVWRPLLIFILGALLAVSLPTGSARLYLLVAVLMFYGMMRCRPLKTMLESRVSRFLGRISFSLYLFHAIVLWTFSLQGMLWLTRHAAASTLNRFCLNLASVAVALAGSRVLVFADDFAVVVSRRVSRRLMATTNRLLAIATSAHASPQGVVPR